MSKLGNFYRGKEWAEFRQGIIFDRMVNGVPICDYCGQAIIGNRQIHVHHIEELTEDNVDDSTVSLNPDNIMVVHHECHNEIHNRFNGMPKHQVFLVYGSACAGKQAYVDRVSHRHDLIINLDNIWECITSNKRYVNDKSLTSVAFQVRNTLLDAVRTRSGRWHNAYIIEGMPSKAKREEFCRIYGAKEVYISSDLETCLSRRKEEGRPEVQDEYIREWFSVNT